MSETKKPTKKTPTKRKPANKNARPNKSRIDKMFEDKDYAKLTGNTISFVDKENEELIALLHNVYGSIKRANPRIKSFDISIMLLFSSIAEVYYLHKDRLVWAKLKEERYQEWIFTHKGHLALNKKIVEDCENELGDEKYGTQRFFELRNEKLKTEKEIITNKQMIKTARRAMQLKMFDVTKGEKLTFDMTAQVISKNEKLMNLMKDFGINPKMVSEVELFSNKKEESNIFKGFGKG